MLNKVPEVTIFFWLIKVLCTTVGETFADNLNEKLKLGLTNTTYIMGALLIASDLRGSVSSYCLHHSRTPVVVVPGIASTQSTHLHNRVAVGVDLTPESAVAQRWASREAIGRDAELVVAHAWQVSPCSLSDLAHQGSTRHAQEARAERELHNRVCGVLGPTPSLHLHADHGSPLDTLLGHTSEADLLVLASRAITRLLDCSADR
jgi:nucleotide-binding universal stress UspA family protein